MTRLVTAGELLVDLGWATLLLALTVVGLVLFPLQLAGIGLVAAVGVGIVLLSLLVPAVRGFAGLHRRWAQRRLGIEIVSPYRPFRSRNPLRWVGRVISDPATWRDQLWLFVNGTVGLVLCALPVVLVGNGAFGVSTALLWPFYPGIAFHGFDVTGPFGGALAATVGAVEFFLGWFATPWLLRANAAVTKSLLAPTRRAELANRVEQLAESRADTVDAQASELRRIERDLHDGAQARLASLAMDLGLAEELAVSEPEVSRQLIGQARESATTALAELRDLVRGIHPPVLADRGLAGAVEGLTLASPIPADLDIDVPGRHSPPVESAAYFAVAEALANAIKHSGASLLHITIGHADGWLTMRLADDGVGGATLDTGAGLRGIQRRLAAFDGTLHLHSPAGGPTIVTMELPCELSSPKTPPSSGTG